MARRIVVLDGFAADQGDVDGYWSGLRALGEVVVYPRSAAREVQARAAGAFAVLTNKVPLGAAAFAATPDLRYVGVTATGTDAIDLAAARAGGVAVTNVPGYSTESVAQLVFALILRFTHDVAGHDAAVKAGAWAASPDFAFFRQPLGELAGKTLAVFGAGAIGNAVVRIASAFGMRTLRAAVPGSTTNVPRTPLDEALQQADVVSLHAPLTAATRGMVDARFLAAMKPSGILINTGRGALVNEADLITALTAGRLRGVGLDVLATEPPAPDHPLCDGRAPWAARVVVTPHIGWGTVEARQRLARIATENLAAFLRGERLNRVD